MRELYVSIYCSLVFMFCIVPSVFGNDLYQSIDRLSSIIPSLDDGNKESLIVDGELTRFYYSGDDVARNIPQAPFTETIIEALESIQPTIGVESILLLPMPDHIKDVSDDKTLMLLLYNTMRSVSTIEGVKYYSASRGHMRVFFDQFYAVTDMHHGQRIEDPLVAKIPKQDRITVFQRDLTFGKNYSSLIYRCEESFINLSIMNLKTMWYGIIPLIRPEHMQVHIVVFPFQNHIIFYGNCGVNTTISLFGIEKSKTDSFYNRIVALFTWFSHQINAPEKVFNKILTKQ